MIFQSSILSPLGRIAIVASEKAVISIGFDDLENITGSVEEMTVIRQCAEELSEYFSGQRTTFSIPLSPKGTSFQRSVWKELAAIPYGQQISYSQLSEKMKQPLAIRAIAAANGRNPLPILIPCHRVVGKRGELVGYSGGIWRKKILLDLESNSLFKPQAFLKSEE